MKLTRREDDLLAAYLASFMGLAGDRRTATLARETLRGILASESLICSRIAAFPPPRLATSRHAERLIRRMLQGETTNRSDFDPDELVRRLGVRGVVQLAEEEVQFLDHAAVRLLVAFGWVAAGFLYELGVTLDWPEVRRAGGEERLNRPPGKQVLMRGLRRLFDFYATEAILADEVRRYGSFPSRLAALIGRSPS